MNSKLKLKSKIRKMNQNLEKHTCGECNFSTSRKFNLIRHHERHHKRQSSFNSYVQKTALEQSPFQGGQAFTQERYQQPVDLDINQEHENLKNDFDCLMKEKNDLVQENQDIKNNLSEQQTKMNVHTQRQGPVKEVYQQPGHVLQSNGMIGNGGA